MDGRGRAAGPDTAERQGEMENKEITFPQSSLPPAVQKLHLNRKRKLCYLKAAFSAVRGGVLFRSDNKVVF